MAPWGLCCVVTPFEGLLCCKRVQASVRGRKNLVLEVEKALGWSSALVCKLYPQPTHPFRALDADCLDFLLACSRQVSL